MSPVRSVIRTVTPQQQLDRLPNIPPARPNPLVRPPMVSNSRALFRSPTEERPVVSTSVSGVMTVTLQNVAIHFPTPKSVELDYEDEEPFLKVTFESLTGQHANFSRMEVLVLTLSISLMINTGKLLNYSFISL